VSPAPGAGAAFADRRDAGQRLAGRLGGLAAERPVVLGLPRGGVPVAAEVAAALGAPLDVIVARKLGAPADPELAVGAIAEEGSLVVDPLLAEHAGLTGDDLDRVLARERAELRRRTRRLRGARSPADLRGRTALVVDDGLATGLTAVAAVRAARRRGAARVVVAAPVGSAEAVALLRRVADEVVCHTVPAGLDGVGRWYRDFAPVAEDAVVAMLEDQRAAA
jgi:predicted phosphoribosyltransferase